MNIWIIVILAFFALFCFYSLWTKEKVVKMLSSLVFAASALFCFFGFLASFEPMQSLKMSLAFKIGYTLFFFIFGILTMYQIASVSKKEEIAS